MLAIACTFVIITGGIDLSVGTLMTFSAVMCGVFLTYWDLPMWTGVVAAIGDRRAVRRRFRNPHRENEDPAVHRHARHDDAAEGAFAGRLRPTSRSISPTPTNFSMISQDSLIGYVLPSVPIPNARADPVRAGGRRVRSSLNRTALGRYTFALGSNEEAVRLSGVNVDRWKIAIYALGGAICGVAGLLIASRLNSAQPALGQGYELEAIAAVVIGGTSLSGGSGTILGTIIGAFIMSVLTNGLRILSVAQEWQIVVTGLIIILAVYADILRRKKS